VVDDIQAIKNLLYSYADLLDTGNFDAFAALFEYATVHISGFDVEYTGSKAVRTLIADPVQCYEGIPSTKHVVTNVTIDLNADGSTATVRSYYTAYQAHGGVSSTASSSTTSSVTSVITSRSVSEFAPLR
jgi:3-phenylpropionate/cinnamic acid dioxygenase small subunit